MARRNSVIRQVPVKGKIRESNGPDRMYVVDLWEDDVLIEQRKLPGKSVHYARDVSENWNNGLIKTSV